jgi:predicted phosphodiesterase
MRIGIVSDTHGHLHNTLSAVRMLESLDVAAVLHCGDICSTAISATAFLIPTSFARPSSRRG